jgi:ABC-2 type transport system permease protein
MSNLSNIVNVARREFSVRVRTRSFLIGTLLLVLGVSIIACLPVIIRYLDRTVNEKVAVYVSAQDIATDPVTTLAVLLNPATTSGQAGTDNPPDFIVSRVTDLAAAREAARSNEYAGVLAIERVPSGELEFTFYTNQNSMGSTASLVRQASTTIAVSDRLARLGVAPTEQAAIYQPADFKSMWPDPARTEPTQDAVAMVGRDMLSFGMTILIFMIIIMYGNWIAMSVVEEKSSRVMEVVLNAASPFQLLTGKVLGVGAVAFVQYAAVVVAGGAALLVQGPIADAILGSAGTATALPEGLTLGLLLMFGVYGVLGFLMYAALYAAAGSLVSRQEDVNAAVMPMTLVSTGGYLIGTYAAMGLLDIQSSWVTVLSQVPFVSPFMMIGRVAAGAAEPWEIILSVALLIASILGAIWLAARIYRAGVLLYGQRPGVRAIWQLVRAGA